MNRGYVVVSVVLLLLLTAGVVSRAPSPPSDPPAAFSGAASVGFTLHGSRSGWGLTAGSISSPGPTLTVDEGDQVTMSLFAADGISHTFFVDYDGDRITDAGEPLSGVFSSPTSATAYSFTADVAGSFTYWCDLHFGSMRGTFTVNAVSPSPIVSLTAPAGSDDWTGGSVHAVQWDMSDLQDANSALTAYLNYTSSVGSGSIAGPIAGAANPNAFAWTVPSIDANDVVVNITVIDTSGLKAWDEASVPSIDSTSPAIVTSVPADGAVGVPTTGVVRVTWSEGMDMVATGAPGTFGLRTVSGGIWISGTFAWNTPSATILTFTPASPLASSTEYEVRVNTTAEDASDPGNGLIAPVTWTFTTGTAPDTAPPSITHAPPSSLPIGEPWNITAAVTDDVGVAEVRVNWTAPGSLSVNMTLTLFAGTYVTTLPSVLRAGTASYYLWATDLAGNGVLSSTQSVPIVVPAGHLVLYGSFAGWGFGPDNLTSPGPRIQIRQGTALNLLLIGLTPARHNFYVDLDGSGSHEPGEPITAWDILGNSSRLAFVADRTGAFTYRCAYHPGTMFGTIEVVTAGASPPDATVWVLAAGGIAVIVVAGVAVFLLRRRRG